MNPYWILRSLHLTICPLPRLDETTPKKRLSLSFRLPSSLANPGIYKKSITILNAFLRLPDTLVSNAHFRGEVTRKVRATRDAEISKIKKFSEKERADERKVKEEKRKKEIHDNKLKSMSTEEQRKLLDKEREKEQRKQQKRMSTKA